MWRAKGCSAIGAAREHHISAVIGAERFDACEHVNIIVSGRPGTVHCHERLSTKAYSIYAALNEVATQVDLSGLVKSRRLPPDLCIGRANAPKRAPAPGEEKVAVRVHVQRTRIRIVWNVNRSLPSRPAVDRAIELSKVAGEKTGPKLI